MRQLDDQEEHTSIKMKTYFDHPSAEELERFALHFAGTEEAELVDTHLLACESCSYALENLRIDIAAMKLAMTEALAEEEQRNREREARKSDFKSRWFSVPTLSWAGAGLVAFAFCLFAFLPVKVELKADRGVESIIVPEWRNTQLNLADAGMPAGPLRAEVVNQTGAVVWTGDVSSAEGKVQLHLPRMTKAGHYYARLYTPGVEHELLSEFPFEVKFQL
jgi:hypothetical protein